MVRLEVLTAAACMKMVFWVVSPCNLAVVYQRHDGGGSKDLLNVGKHLTYYTALQPRRQPSSY
jgi:hypothetical protein